MPNPNNNTTPEVTKKVDCSPKPDPNTQIAPPPISYPPNKDFSNTKITTAATKLDYSPTLNNKDPNNDGNIINKKDNNNINTDIVPEAAETVDCPPKLNMYTQESSNKDFHDNSSSNINKHTPMPNPNNNTTPEVTKKVDCSPKPDPNTQIAPPPISYPPNKDFSNTKITTAATKLDYSPTLNNKDPNNDCNIINKKDNNSINTNIINTELTQPLIPPPPTTDRKNSSAKRSLCCLCMRIFRK